MSQRNIKGFTIVELMLAMAFISFLLVGIALLTVNISKIYTQGVTYKELNQVGSEISADLRRTVSASKVEDIKFINNSSYDRLCLGKYSYVWNEGTATAAKYGSPQKTARLVKVTDPTSKYCATPYLASVAPGDEAVDVLSAGGDRNLIVYNLNITPLQGAAGTLQTARAGEVATGRGLYTISLTIGTGDTAQINSSTSLCNPPAGAGAGDEYCAINTFTIVAAIGNTYIPTGGN